MSLIDSFIDSYKKTSAFEGGYVNDPKDPGLETYCGISRRWHKKWPGWKIVDLLKPDKKALKGSAELEKMVKDFYMEEFWLKIGCDVVCRMSPVIAGELFEAAVNVSPDDAVRFLQESLNMLRFKDDKELYGELSVDGIMGAATIESLRRCLASSSNSETLIFNCMNGEQYIFYKENPQHKRYRGWFARV